MGEPITVNERMVVVKRDVVGNSVMWSSSMDPLSAYVDHDGFEELEIDGWGNLYITLKFYEENCTRISKKDIKCKDHSWIPCKVLVAEGVKDFTIDVKRHQRHPGDGPFSDLYETDSAKLGYTLLTGAKISLSIDEKWAKKQIETSFGFIWNSSDESL
jgi:hypothetical protein